jgi:toxin ParE2
VTVRFLDIAEIELDDAVRWYQAQAAGLGDALLLEVMTAADRIARYPEAWHLLEQGIRRCRLTRFPYGLIYAIEKEDIIVLAVAHLHRRPDYWRDRLEKNDSSGN